MPFRCLHVFSSSSPQAVVQKDCSGEADFRTPEGSAYAYLRYAQRAARHHQRQASSPFAKRHPQFPVGRTALEHHLADQASPLRMITSRTSGTTAFATAATLGRPTLSKPLRCSRRRARTTAMTLQPQDSSWQEERDRRAIESEFLVTVPVTGEVDNDMAMLRERMQMLGRKEKQWADICQQFISLSILTGIPLIDPENGEPTARAWLFLSLSAAIPLYVLCLGAQWLHSTSVSFSHLL